MSEAREREIQVLREMQASDGWRIFVAQVRDQWQGENFVGRLKMAVQGKPTEAGQAESVREVFASRTAIESLLFWPEQRIAKLKAAITADETPVDVSARRA